MKNFTGKAAFIAGDASGVGLGQAKVCAAAGAKVVIADSVQLRPAGDYGQQTDAPMLEALKRVFAQGMDPVELARHVKAPIERDDLYIIPCPEERAALQAHFDAVLAALPPESSDAEGMARRCAALARFGEEARAVLTARQ